MPQPDQLISDALVVDLRPVFLEQCDLSAVLLGKLCVVVQEALVFRGWYVGVFPALIYREIEGVPAFPALVDQPYVDLAAVSVDAEFSRVFVGRFSAAAGTAPDHCERLCRDKSVFNF